MEHSSLPRSPSATPQGRAFTDYAINDSRDHWPHGDEDMPPPRQPGPVVKWIYTRPSPRSDADPFPPPKKPGILGKLLSWLYC